ncbi:chlorohydrolase [Streptococcus pneumoniae]|nr:chlorohydrolase [Streptococcus pneumoniae]
MGKLLTRGFHILFVKRSLYSMKIKEQTRKRAASCSKHCFEVVDRTDEGHKYIYGKAKLTWFEEIFEGVLVKNVIKEK